MSEKYEKLIELCGVCNDKIDWHWARMMRMESDQTVTHYHTYCSQKAKDLKPCEDCGHHKVFCNECKE